MPEVLYYQRLRFFYFKNIMKLYRIKVIDRKTNEVLVDTQERSGTKKRLQLTYASRYKFHENVVSIEITRLTRMPGIQLNIIDAIQNGTD